MILAVCHEHAALATPMPLPKRIGDLFCSSPRIFTGVELANDGAFLLEPCLVSMQKQQRSASMAGRNPPVIALKSKW